MRSATTVITLLTIATSLFSCQKDKTSTLASPAITPSTAIKDGSIPPVQTGSISYLMSTRQPGQTDVIKWNSGNMNVYTVGFEGCVQVGNAMQKLTYTTGVGGNRVLYTPSFQLNSVVVPYFTYSEPVFRVSLNPYGSTSLYLTGTAVKHMTVGKDAGSSKYAAVLPVQVQLKITDAIDLTTTYTPTATIDFGNYGARLFFDPGKLLTGISQDMIDNALVSQNTMVISKKDNVPIYNMILANIKSTLSVDFSRAFSPSPI